MSNTQEAPIRVLLIEDDDAYARLLALLLARSALARFEVRRAARLEDGLAALAAQPVDAAVLDLGLPDAHGAEIVARVRAAAPDTAVVVLTGRNDEASALAALAAGAQDYLNKDDPHGPDLARALRFAVEHKRLQNRLQADAERRNEVIALQQAIATAKLDLEAVLATIVERVRYFTGATGAVVELREGDDMVYRAASGSAAASLGLRLKIASSLSGLCVRTGEILRCDDAETDPRVDREACRRVQARSMVVVPLLLEAGVAGVLKVMSAEPAAFTTRDVETLQLLAGLVGAALSHAAAYAAMKASEDHYSLIFKSTSDALLVTEQGRVIDANPAVERLLGYARAEALGRDWLDFFAPAGHPALMAATTEGHEAPRDVEAAHRDGGAIFVEFFSSPALMAGRPRRIISLRDVTARRQLEQVREDFQAMLVHDLRSPLTTIVGYNDLMASAEPPLAVDQFQAFAGSALAAAERMLVLINDILDLSRLEAGKVRLELARVATGPLLRAVLDELRPLAQARDLALSWPDQDGLPAVRADARKLQQVLVNLVGNAIKFARSRVAVRVAVRDGRLELRVEDDGPGILPEERVQLFNKWEQTSSGRAMEKGSGLGLVIARLLAEAHGGALEVGESADGGAAFVLTLPCEAPAPVV